MRVKTICSHCGSNDVEYIGNNQCYCNECKTERQSKDVVIESRYESARNAVSATGNRWANENFYATHQ